MRAGCRAQKLPQAWKKQNGIWRHTTAVLKTTPGQKIPALAVSTAKLQDVPQVSVGWPQRAFFFFFGKKGVLARLKI